MRLGLVLLIFCAVAAQSARADAPVDDGMVIAAVDYADTWWTDLGSPPPCAHHADLVWEDWTDAFARAAPGCRVEWSRFHVARLRWYLAHGRFLGERFVGGWLYRRQYLSTLCAVAIHERGHNLGYGHDAGGIMASLGSYFSPPGGCVLWASRMLPHRRLRKLNR